MMKGGSSKGIYMSENLEWLILNRDIQIDYTHVLGEGQFGIVYKATWREITVAVKQFHPIHPSKIKLIQNEFEVMTKLHHPHIIQLLGYIENPFSIVMEYIPKGSLSHYLKTHRYVSFATKLQFIIDICLGLTYLHQRQPSFIIHRDIKPSNFLLTQDFRIKIADFGICKLLHNENEWAQVDQIQGTPNVGSLYYMAPEIIGTPPRLNDIKSYKYNTRVDIYSIGSVMYEILEGRKLFQDASSKQSFLQHIYHQHRPSFSKCPSFLTQIILQCLHHDPSCRPEAFSLIQSLRAILQKHWWLKWYVR